MDLINSFIRKLFPEKSLTEIYETNEMSILIRKSLSDFDFNQK